jgi:transposase
MVLLLRVEKQNHKTTLGTARGVVAVARKRGAPISQIAKDSCVSGACIHRWLKIADVEGGVKPGVTKAESDEIRELKERNRILEREAEAMRRAVAYFSRDANPERPTR